MENIFIIKIQFWNFLGDDIEVNIPYADQIFGDLLTHLPTVKFDICLLSMNTCKKMNCYEGKSLGKFLYNPKEYGTGAYSYILSKDGAQKLVKYYEKIKIYHQVDVYHILRYNYSREIGGNINIMCVIPFFKYNNNFSVECEYGKGTEFLFYVKDWSDSDIR